MDMSESTNSDGLSVSDWRSFRVGHSVYLLASLGIRSLGGDPGNRCFTRTSLRLKQDFYYGVVLVRFHAQEKKQCLFFYLEDCRRICQLGRLDGSTQDLSPRICIECPWDLTRQCSTSKACPTDLGWQNWVRVANLVKRDPLMVRPHWVVQC